MRFLRRDRRGAVALMVGVMSPMLMGFAAMTVDAGFWIIGQTRLQVAADAGAMGAGFLLVSSNFKAMSPANQNAAAAAVAQAEAKGAMNKMMGTLVTPVTVSVASDYSSVTVTIYSQASNIFGGVFNIAAPLMRATATAGVKTSAPCVLALGTTGNAVKLDNSGTITAASCSVDSKASIYLDSGTVTATAIVAAGSVTQSNSGSNSMTPSTPTQNSTSVPPDPYAGNVAPKAGSCTTHPDYTAYSASAYVANPGTWCGDQTIGGNGSTITFNPGVYIISNGNLTFNNATINSATGVTFVLTGSSPGSFSWTNYSNTSTLISAPTSGPTSGIVIWQTCGTNQTTSFQGGSTLVLSGAVYMPCSAVDVGNNAQVKAPLNGTMTFIGKTVYVHGSAVLAASGSGTGTAGGSTAVLTQ